MTNYEIMVRLRRELSSKIETKIYKEIEFVHRDNSFIRGIDVLVLFPNKYVMLVRSTKRDDCIRYSVREVIYAGGLCATVAKGIDLEDLGFTKFIESLVEIGRLE